jgi:hypothetical protein
MTMRSNGKTAFANVSGVHQPGHLNAVMGPPGCGVFLWGLFLSIAANDAKISVFVPAHRLLLFSGYPWAKSNARFKECKVLLLRRRVLTSSCRCKTRKEEGNRANQVSFTDWCRQNQLPQCSSWQGTIRSAARRSLLQR